MESHEQTELCTSLLEILIQILSKLIVDILLGLMEIMMNEEVSFLRVYNFEKSQQLKEKGHDNGDEKQCSLMVN